MKDAPADSVFISFAQEGLLPGPASVYISLNGFNIAEKYYLYRYDNNEAVKLGNPISPENGYIALTLETRGDIILSPEEIRGAAEETVKQTEEKTEAETAAEETAEDEILQSQEQSPSGNGNVTAVIIIAAAVVVLGGAAVFFIRRRKKNV